MTTISQFPLMHPLTGQELIGGEQGGVTSQTTTAAIAALNSGVSAFNTRSGAVTLTSGDVTSALSFTPYNATNPSGYITSASLPNMANYAPIAGVTGGFSVGGTAALQSVTATNLSLSGTAMIAGSESNVQSSPLLGVRSINNSNQIEFGHPNQAGYGSTIGALSNSGRSFIAFNAEANASVDNAYSNRGRQGAVIQADGLGGWIFGQVIGAVAAPVALKPVMTLDNTGLLTVSGGTGAGITTSGMLTSLAGSGSQIVLNSPGQYFGVIGNPAPQVWCLGHASPPTNPPSQTLSWAATRTITFNAYGTGTLSSNAAGLITASDGRYKTKTRGLSNALATVQKLIPTYYRWKADGPFASDYEELGFVAQEVAAVIPEASPEPETADKFKNYHDRAILAFLVKAVQEQQLQIEALKARIY